MFYFYPSNRLHDLAEMLSAVVNTRQTAPLSATQTLVQHTGMQHWLSLKLAELNKIAMNIDFPLPTRFVWECCRSILGDNMIPEQSPYKREIMVWRILKLLKYSAPEALPSGLRNFIFNDDLSIVSDEVLFSFARQVADVFEQYIVFRPKWIKAWDEQSFIDDLKIAEMNNGEVANMAQWQSWIWLQLQAETPYHPVNLQAKVQALLTQEVFDNTGSKLPADVYVFAINTLPSQYFDFFTSLSKVINIHFFMLNPCENYWGDALSNAQIAKQLRQHAQFDVIASNELNPLLRNMGQQGKELLNQVLEQEHLEIASFRTHANAGCSSMLSLLQDDIQGGAVFDNVCESDTGNNPNDEKSYVESCLSSDDLDGSIQVHGCYSQVRELQVLKDFLLDAFAKDPMLKLHDVLIMCPAIEDYAPYIQAIFETSSLDAKSLAISISDRRPLESETAVESFMQVISMNQTRFSLETVLSPLVDASLAASFSLSDDDIQKVQLWFEKAAIVWGIDAEDKSEQLDSAGLNSRHTWANGLSRLIYGALNQQNIMWADDVACVEAVEGLNQIVLGRFIAYLDWLISVNKEFDSVTSLTEWTTRLLKVLARYKLTGKNLRQVDTNFGVSIVEKAIADLGQNLNAANCDLETTWLTVVTALKQLLSIPETKAKFMAGKITFCSMMPMRSVPFKVIGILGLNQDKYPRKSVLSELDLMSLSARKVGDRSRSNDDRYLFLEAMLSAESTLYLSYLHRSVKDNTERMPSLVLKELVDYCQQRFGENKLQVQMHGLHPFSADEFVSNTFPKHFLGADAAWFSKANYLVQNAKDANENQSDSGSTSGRDDRGKSDLQKGFKLGSLNNTLHLNEIVRFYQHPIRYFANKRLQVYFPNVEIDVFEQTFDYTKQHRRHVRNLLVDQLSINVGDGKDNSISEIDAKSQLARLHAYFLASGDLPDLTFLQDIINEETILMQLLVEQQKAVVGQVSGELKILGINLQYSLAVDAGNMPMFFSKEAEFSDYERLAIWLNLLCLASAGQGLCAEAYYARMYRGKPKLEKVEMSVPSQERAQTILENFVKHYINGCDVPLPMQLSFAKELKKMESAVQAMTEEGIQNSWRKRSQVKSRANPLGLQDDAYMQYLFDGVPELSVDLLEVYFDTYLSMFK